MKMKLHDRILLALYSLIGVAGSVVLGYVAVLVYVSDGLRLDALGIQLPGGVTPLVIFLAIAVVILAWSVKMLTLAFRHEPKIDKTSVSVQNTEDGSVRITVAAMDTLIRQAIGHHKGILDVKSKIINHEDSISVRIDMTLASDVHIPNVTMLLQRTVKNFIEEFSGIAVREVSVLVSSIVEIVPAPLALETGKHPVEPETVETPEETSQDETPEETVYGQPEIVIEDMPAEETAEDEPATDDEAQQSDTAQDEGAADGEGHAYADQVPETAAEERNPEKEIW